MHRDDELRAAEPGKAPGRRGFEAAEPQAFLAGARAALECADLREAARQILGACLARLDAADGFVALRASDGALETIAERTGSGAPLATHLAAGHVLEAVLERRKTLIIGDEPADRTAAPPRPEASPPPRLLVVPLEIGGAAQGLLALGHKPGGFSSTDALTAQAFAQLVALALDRIRRTEKLRVSEAQVGDFVDTAQEGLCTLGPGSVVTALNQHGAAMLGRKVEEVIGRPITDFLPPEDREEHLRDVQFRGIDGPSLFERRFVHLDGSIRKAFVRVVPRRDAAGRVIGAFGTLTDATPEQVTRGLLRAAQADLSAILEASPDGVLMIHSEGMITRVNKCFLEIWRVPDGTPLLLGEDALRHMVAQAERPEEMLAQLQLSASELGLRQQYTVDLKDGRVIAVTTRPQRLDGRVVGRVYHFAEITEQIRAERALRERESQFRALVEHLPDVVGRFDRQGRILYLSPSFRQVFRHPAEELIGHRLRDLEGSFPLAAQLAVALEQAFSGASELSEIEFTLPSGQSVSVDGRFVAERGDDDEVHTVLMLLRDISSRHRSELALQESEARYRSLFEDSHTVMMLVEPQTGTVVDSNAAACGFYGYPRHHLLSMKVADLELSPGPWVLAEWERALQTPLRINSVALLASGERREVEVHCGPIRIHGLSLLYAIVHDVSERRRAEATLRRLWAAIEQTRECVAITDADRLIEYVNPAFEGLTGYARDEALGRPLAIVHDGADAAGAALLRAQGQWMGAVLLRRKEGPALEVEASLAALREQSGQITGYVAVYRDVTEQRRLERQLRQSQKMEALGTLAGGIAHDFNNILAAIMGFTTLAQSQLPEDHPARPDLQEVVTASQRARDLVKQILAFSRRTEHRLSPLQVSVLAKEALKLLRATLPSTIAIRSQLAAKDDFVLGDPTQIHQIVMNLCTNAAQAMRERGGVLSVCCEVLHADALLAASVTGLRAGPYVRIRVQDTGHGMDAGTLERVFEPYFTTKMAGDGTGLGLPVVHGIVLQSGGAISVTSEPGLGTTVDVWLPRHLEEPPAVVTAPSSAPRGIGRILFVDDEPPLARLGKQILEGLGYQVVSLSNPSDALDLFEEKPEAFDLVVTDQTMPHVTGLTLAREIHEVRPELPILLCTGYSESIPADGAQSLGVRQVLLKPLPPHELAHAVAAALRRDGEQ
ncbi:MAG: PAS domain S-box protein [Deltaproteobacteria bacterium]|nr:PAS domain S-box protein [Deltaproteobacteria bacterium]